MALWPSNFIPVHTPDGNVYIAHENYEKEVPKSTVCNSSNWKHPKLLSTVEWVNKVLYIHIMECYTPMIIKKLNHMQQHGLKLPNKNKGIQDFS